MKQMPLDDGEMNGAGMGLRVKKGAMGAQAAEEFELAAPVIDGSENRPFEEQLDEPEPTFLEQKKMFA